MLRWFKLLLHSFFAVAIAAAAWMLSNYYFPSAALFISIGGFFFLEVVVVFINLMEGWERIAAAMEASQQKLEREIAISEQRIEQATGIWRKASGDNFLLKDLEEILFEYDRIKSDNDVFFLQQARIALDIAKESMAKISDRELRDRPMEQTNLLYMKFLYTNANWRIRSSSYEEITEWWDSPDGVQYWQFNVEALKRGILIERIFVINQGNDLKNHPKLAALMNKQASHQPPVKVFLAKCDHKLEKNIVIFDNKDVPKYAVWVTPSADNQIKMNRWNMSGIPRVVAELENTFELIKGVSEEYHPNAAGQPTGGGARRTRH